MTDKYYRIILDSTQAEKGAKSFDSAMRGAGKSGDKLSGTMGRTQKGAGQAGFAMKKLAVAIGAALSVRKVIQYSDAWKSTQNQLRQVTSTQQELADVSRVLLDVSNDTRSSLESTTTLFSRLSRSTQEMDVSTTDLVGVTKTINQLFAASGATAQEASNAIRQLSQGLAAGALRGDEFNSVAEQAPGIMRAIAAETGLSIGELREFAAQGGITSEILVTSLQNYGDEADIAFGKTERTFGQSMVVARNNMIAIAGALNQVDSVLGGVGDAFADVSGEIAAIAQSGQINAVIDLIGSQFEATAKDITNLLNSLLDVYHDFTGGITEESNLIGFAFTNIVPVLRSVVQIITVEAANAIAIIGEVKEAAEQTINPFDGISRSDAVKELSEDMGRLLGARADSIALIKLERDTQIDANMQKISSLKQLRIEYEKTRPTADSLTGGGSSDGTGGGDTEPVEADFTLKALQNETAQMAAELELRKTIQTEYSQLVFDARVGSFEREKAALDQYLAEERGSKDLQLQADLADIQLRREKIQEDRELEFEAKGLYLTQLNEQEILLTEEKQQFLTELETEGAEARKLIAEAEADFKLNIVQSSLSDIAGVLLQGGKKSFEIGKKASLASAGIKGVESAVDAWQSGMSIGGPFAPVFAAAYAGASLLKTNAQINRIKSMSYGGGGGGGSSGGGGASLPSVGGASGGSLSQSSIPTTANQTQQQRTVIDLRGATQDDLIRVDTLAEALESTNVAVAINGSLREASRIGAIV